MEDSKPSVDPPKVTETKQSSDTGKAPEPSHSSPDQPAAKESSESTNPSVAKSASQPSAPAEGDAAKLQPVAKAESQKGQGGNRAKNSKAKKDKQKEGPSASPPPAAAKSEANVPSEPHPVTKKKEYIVLKKTYPDVRGPEDRMMAGHHGWERSNSQIQSDTMKTYVNTIESDELYPLRRYELHGHEIWEHQAQKDPKPQTPIMVTQAFGNFMFSKMVRVLKHRDLIVRQKAMVWAVELLSVPEDCSRCFAAGIVPILANMFKEEDLFIRQQLALCFKYITVRKVGAIEACKLGAIQGLVNMLKDNDTTLRTNAFHALLEAAHYEIVRKELVNGGSTLEFFLKRVDEEKEKTCLILGLDLLSECLDTGTDKVALAQLLKVNAVLSALRHLSHLDPSVKECAAQFLCLLCMDKSAKAQAVEHKAVKTLIPLLNDIEPRVQALAAAALMRNDGNDILELSPCFINERLGSFIDLLVYDLSVREAMPSSRSETPAHKDSDITINIDGKKSFLNEGGVPKCVDLLDEQDERICLNMLQLMTNVAEHPTARLGYGSCPGLQNGIPVCDRLFANTFTGLLTKRCAVSCKEMLNFRHRPFNIDHAHR